MIASKTCPECRKTLSAAAFNASQGTADGLARRCRACTNARRRRRDRSRVESRQSARNLAAALRQGDVFALRKLVRAGAKPHWSWVCETMRGGHVKLAKVLLEAGVEQNAFTMAAMADLAVLRRRLRRVPADARQVVEMEPNSNGVTPLHVACASDWSSHGQDRMTAQVAVAEILTEDGVDVAARAFYRGLESATPLFCACWSSANLALVRWLLDHGTIATERDFRAALGHFQRHDRAAYDIAEALLAWGVPIDGGISGERTPLQGFAHQGAHQTVSWLIARGADVNARGPGGRTAAHLAAERNTGPRTLAVLVEAGADLSARDEDGHTPLDIARLNEKTRVVEWIKRRPGGTRRSGGFDDRLGG
ncbi:MAG: ankyrin repeat domain-containing protein [Planctomycetes bacterium]|nr:ankyrin repeat domain-containing protein [Planctomycetota bacterium]